MLPEKKKPTEFRFGNGDSFGLIGDSCLSFLYTILIDENKGSKLNWVFCIRMTHESLFEISVFNIASVYTLIDLGLLAIAKRYFFLSLSDLRIQPSLDFRVD
jgi:hypothetical protein